MSFPQSFSVGVFSISEVAMYEVLLVSIESATVDFGQACPREYRRTKTNYTINHSTQLYTQTADLWSAGSLSCSPFVVSQNSLSEGKVKHCWKNVRCTFDKLEGSWTPKISSLKSWSSILPTSNRKKKEHFPISLSFLQPITFILVVSKPRGSSCSRHRKPQKKTARLAAAKEISMGTVVYCAVVLQQNWRVFSH